MNQDLIAKARDNTIRVSPLKLANIVRSIVNKKANSTIYDQKIICYNGLEYITEEINKLKFKIGPKSFYQTNSNQAKILYQKAKELAQIKENEVVYDLYTGIGTIAQYVAKFAAKVILDDFLKEL